jgi:preprotein translocase subunit SecD
MVQVGFDESGALRLEAFSAEHVGDALGIVIDGKLISTPVIQTEIGGGEVVIAGNFSEAEARELALQFQTVPLRIRLEPLEVS